MEDSSCKMEAVKPVLLKAGIPLAIALAGCVFARIASRKYRLLESRGNSQEIDTCETNRDEESFQSLDSGNVPRDEADHTKEPSLVKRVLGLRSRIEEIQDRELKLEKRFLYYQDLKDREMVLIELKNKCLLETNRVEFLGREISLLEAENQRFEAIGVEFLKVLGMLEFSRSENEKLHVRVKKLLGRTKEQSRVLRKQSLEIGFREKEISKNEKEVEERHNCIRLMEDEIKKLKIVNEILREEKSELLDKLRVSEESAMSKVEEEKYNNLASELERMKKDEAGQVREMIHLKWRNACLKHELMRRNHEQEEEEKAEENNEVDVDCGGIGEINEGFGSDNELRRCNQFRVHPRRQRLIAKFKRWVEGSEKGKQHNSEGVKDEYGNKCFPTQRSVSDGVEETCVLPGKSCSSV